MADFLLELRSEEIPARMQAAAIDQLVVRFGDGLKGARLPVAGIDGFVGPRRLVLHARGLGAAGAAVSDERRGPRADAPDAAVAGFLKSTGLTRDQLEERDTPKGRFLYATIASPGRSAEAILAELVPAIVHGFDWPKSMRWGAASASPASLRWVRPLSGIVALLGDAVVPFDVAGLASGRITQGHRAMAAGDIEIASADSYAGQLRAAFVMIDAAERREVIAAGVEAAAAAEGLTLIADAGLVAENAGLTEWPVPLLGRFDPAYLDVPREVVQLTMRTNQKYFAATDAACALAPVFVCVANLAAADGGADIVAGNRKVLAARLADAKFFWDADRAVTLEARLPKLADIVFHEKLGTVADKVARVAKLARWLVESGAINPPRNGEGDRASSGVVEGRDDRAPRFLARPPLHHRKGDGPPPRSGEDLARLAEQAARLCKADLVSATVGEFPEVQGIAGGYLALAEGLPHEVAAAIRDHYKPVGQGDDVPTAPVTVAVALADKLDTLFTFFSVRETPTGSRDPFALRRAALGIVEILFSNSIRISLMDAFSLLQAPLADQFHTRAERMPEFRSLFDADEHPAVGFSNDFTKLNVALSEGMFEVELDEAGKIFAEAYMAVFWGDVLTNNTVVKFLADRLKVQQREAGVRHDLIDAVFALGGEDDLVRLLARVHALQAVLQTPNGASLLAGYKRAANILRIETRDEAAGTFDAALLAEPAERALAAALDAAVPAVADAVAAEDFTGAMAALAGVRPAVDGFFDAVTVNAPDPALRANRLALLARLRDAVHSVADFSKVEG